MNDVRAQGKVKFEPDYLDRKLFEAFPGLVIRKDLTQDIRGTSKAPSYVIEFMLGKYCANLFDEEEVHEGLRFVHEEIAKYIPRGDETEVIKSAIREKPSHKLIDMVKVELDEKLKEGVYWARLSTANIQNIHISTDIVKAHERLLLGGVWSRVTLHYDNEKRYGKKTYPFVISRLDPIQVSHVSIEEYRRGRTQFTRDEWIDVLVRTMGYETTHPRINNLRTKLLYLVRMIPLVESNYHLIELGPRQTGKSFCFTDDKNLYKTYMESGQINRGTITVAGDAGFVFNGNIEFNPRENMLQDHLFKPLPSSISDDLAFHDRWAAYLPGWELPKLIPEMFTKHVGFILDYTSELFHDELRRITSYATLWERWFEASPDEWSARDMRSINHTFSGLTKLIFPSGIMEKEDARILLEMAMELRLRILLQLHTMSSQEFPHTQLSHRDKETTERKVVQILGEGKSANAELW